MPEPLSRRAFLELTAAAGGATLLGACGDDQSAASATPAAWVKDPTPFFKHPTNLETRLEQLAGLITPNELFFVRNHTPTPRIDAATYRLRVEGDAVGRPLELTYDEILALPSRSVIAYLECAGNWRRFFAEVMGRAAQGGQWGTGGVSCAEWTGTPLRSVLELAGVRRNAVDVNLFGLDQGEFNRPMPLIKALDDDTLLVYAMNGATLPPDHGFPLRAVVPGWVGSSSVKWLGRIVVSSEKQWVKNNTTSYVLIGDRWPKERYAPAEGGPITTQNVKSAVALPWPATLAAGRRRIRGFASSPAGVQRVEWSTDAGNTWNAAQMLEPRLEHAWIRFEFLWDATPGKHTLMTRAVDRAGDQQPMVEQLAYNEKGYLFNAALPHPIQVTA